MEQILPLLFLRIQLIVSAITFTPLVSSRKATGQEAYPTLLQKVTGQESYPTLLQKVTGQEAIIHAIGRLHRPIRAAAGLDGDEIEGGDKLPVLGEIELPERKEVLAHVQTLQAAVGAVHELVECVYTAPLEVPCHLRQIAKLNHRAPPTTWQYTGYLIPAKSCNKCQFSRRSCCAARRV